MLPLLSTTLLHCLGCHLCCTELCDALDDITVSACLPQVTQVTATEMTSQSTSQPSHLHLLLHLPSPNLSALLGHISDTPGDITVPASAPGQLGSPRGLQSPGGTARVVRGQPGVTRAPQEGRQEGEGVEGSCEQCFIGLLGTKTRSGWIAPAIVLFIARFSLDFFTWLLL